MKVFKAAEPYGGEYKKEIRTSSGTRYTHRAGIVYFLPTEVTEKEEICNWVVQHMKELFCNDHFRKMYKDIATEKYSSQQKEEELDPKNTKSNSFWKKIEDALMRPEASILHLLRYKLQVDHARIVFAQMFRNGIDVDKEIVKYWTFYDLNKGVKGKQG